MNEGEVMEVIKDKDKKLLRDDTHRSFDFVSSVDSKVYSRAKCVNLCVSLVSLAICHVISPTGFLEITLHE